MTDELKPCAVEDAMERAMNAVGFVAHKHDVSSIAHRFLTHLADNLPDAMVEAGARAFWNDEQPDDEPQWDDVEMEHPVEIKSEIRSGIKAALTTALNVKEVV